MSSEFSSETEVLARRSAAEIGRAIGAGAADPRALVEHYLAQTAAAGEAGAETYVRLTPERARREATAAFERAKNGLRRGPLDGVPVSWKDLFDLAGVPTEAGSKLCEGVTPAHDAPIVARGAQAGLVSLGKTHLSELAFSGLGYNPMTATSPNPFDPARVPGGSSSGAAASVAFGLAAAAIGSDTGGSVRIPAAWQGLVGLKTTHGLIPLDGVTPLSPSLDTAGPLCRTVEDAALLHAVLADRPAPDLTHASLSGRVVFVPETVVFEDMPEDLRAGFEAALEKVAAAGARITRGPVPEFADALAIAAKNGAIVNTEGYAVWKETIEARPDAMFPMILARFRSGSGFTADQIEFTRLEMKRLQRSYLARMGGYDAILMPATGGHAPKTADIAEDEAAYIRENLLALRNTRLANLLALCSIVIPAGATQEGLPVSVMAFEAPFQEARALRIGAALEAILASG